MDTCVDQSLTLNGVDEEIACVLEKIYGVLEKIYGVLDKTDEFDEGI